MSQVRNCTVKSTPKQLQVIGESLLTLFALINICLSPSDDANKIGTLNIKRA